MMAKAGELKRAAQQLGVTSATLRQHGWKTASPERVQAAKEEPPEWLTEARKRRRQKQAKQRALRERKTTAKRLGIQVRAVEDRDIKPGDVDDLLATRPSWLVREQEQRQAQIEREAKERLRRELTDALAGSVHEVWFQELKRATTDAEVDAIDARWAPEVDRAKLEARGLVDELTPEQVRGRIDREAEAAHAAGVVRATQLARRAPELGGDGG
jgi:hypothetical protein